MSSAIVAAADGEEQRKSSGRRRTMATWTKGKDRRNRNEFGRQRCQWVWDESAINGLEGDGASNGSLGKLVAVDDGIVGEDIVVLGLLAVLLAGKITAGAMLAVNLLSVLLAF
jgi:hypothetical protein